MPAYVALLRAINVGGTGKLPMPELKRLCEELGFTSVKTYIASGNVVFRADGDEPGVKAALTAALAAFMGKPTGVLLRTAAEIAAVAAANPFPQHPSNQTAALFLDHPPQPTALERLKGRQDEEAHLGHREIYLFYPSGMGRSKLVIPEAAHGTMRNLNTVTKLAEMAAAI